MDPKVKSKSGSSEYILECLGASSCDEGTLNLLEFLMSSLLRTFITLMNTDADISEEDMQKLVDMYEQTRMYLEKYPSRNTNLRLLIAEYVKIFEEKHLRSLIGTVPSDPAPRPPRRSGRLRALKKMSKYTKYTRGSHDRIMQKALRVFLPSHTPKKTQGIHARREYAM